MPNFLLCSCSNNNNLINKMPILLCYPTFDKLDHQLIVGYMPCPINLPLQGLNLLICIWKKEWIGGLKSFDIVKDGGNVCYNDMFGIQTFC